MGTGTMGAMGASAPTGKIPWGHSPHGQFPRIYAPVTKIHRPSSIVFNFYVEYRNKTQIYLINCLFLSINIHIQ